MLFFEIFTLTISFLLGASIGSFIGVLIDRLPRHESIVFPSSHCTNCGAELKWYQNIPVFSYLALRGKCANCKIRIPVKFFIIELTAGVVGILVGIAILSSF